MWRPVDTEFFAPRLPVGVVALSGSDADYLRTMLESLRCVVHVHWIGTPADFLKVISQGAGVPRYLVIDGHGTEQGLYFGEYAKGIGIDTSMLTEGCLPPDAIHGRVDLPGCTVINLVCLGGTKRMADAFLAGKVQAYIGCRDYVDGSAMELFFHNLMYNIVVRKMSDRDAWYHAVAVTDHAETDLISFYHADGKEERYVRPEAGRRHA